MTPTAESDFQQQCERIRALWLGSSLAEAETKLAAGERKIPERLVQAIWYEKLLQPQGLKTVSGKPLEIHGPGRWNESAGPDFIGADLSINGRRARGDVEVHVRSGDWARHGHSRDYAYNNVILHVFLSHDDERSHEELHNGQRCEGFAMEPVLFPDLETIRQTLAPEDYPYNTEAGLGRCHEYLIQEEEQVIRQFLASGGRERMESKVRRLMRQAEGSNLSQLLYQALMTSMGFKGNKTLFFLLSKRAPVEELLGCSRHLDFEERVECVQAILLHVAGLTPRTGADQDALSTETLEYLNRLNRHWSEVSGYFADRLIPPTRRWHGGVRPVNFPERRLAGIARFVVRHSRGQDLFTPFLEKVLLMLPDSNAVKAFNKCLKQVEQLFVVEEPADFWSRRYSFASKQAPVPMSLIGDSRARSTVFNSMLPMMILYARQKRDGTLEQKLWAWFEVFPSLESNNIIRFMCYRLFGNDARGSSLIHNEMMQQGLFQVFHSCCNNNERDCTQCLFLKNQGLCT